jgi:hypothetical protein
VTTAESSDGIDRSKDTATVEDKQKVATILPSRLCTTSRRTCRRRPDTFCGYWSLLRGENAAALFVFRSQDSVTVLVDACCLTAGNRHIYMLPTWPVVASLASCVKWPYPKQDTPNQVPVALPGCDEARSIAKGQPNYDENNHSQQASRTAKLTWLSMRSTRSKAELPRKAT